MKKFVPVEGKSRVQIDDCGTGINLQCIDGNVVDVSIIGFGMYKTFVKNVPISVFKSNIQALKRDLTSRNQDSQYRLFEWHAGDGLTIRKRDFMIRFTTSESRLQSFLAYADDFLDEVQEHIHAQFD
jgi:hypothetical protein|uniref:Uncharacterized protein n=1 Tax=Podoviridae sp. ctrub15 TaxID=2826581 RepID=A0A8S5LV60_9CAUD|nr:MAG TPA: hypothetical protein [Podoviridae sp. ctrub15]